jgi:hypothetical protein
MTAIVSVTYLTSPSDHKNGVRVLDIGIVECKIYTLRRFELQLAGAEETPKQLKRGEPVLGCRKPDGFFHFRRRFRNAI